MTLRNRFALIAATLGLTMVLVACGGSSLQLSGSPSGTFSNASLSGAYVFAINGTNQNGFLTVAGRLQADGNGNITSGTEDLNSGSGVFTNLPLNGTYSVGADGRGVATLISSTAVITLDFVLISSQHGLISRFDNNSSASGTLDLQSAATTSPQGQFAFNLSGIDASGGPVGSVGTISPDGAGNLGAGIQDINDNGTTNLNLALSGFYTFNSATGRGTAALTTSSGTLSFAFYVIDSNHLKLIETDTVPVLAGDVFRMQPAPSNASLAGSYAFTLGGSAGGGPFVAGGVLTADGNGNVTGGAEDLNSNGTIVQNLATTGNYAIASSGRGTLTLNNSAGASNFVVYPTTGGLQMLQTDTTPVSNGVALAQQGSAFSTATLSGDYGFNLTGVGSGGEIDSIAKVSAGGNGTLSGAVDFNIVGTLFQGLALNGTYTLAGNGRGTATLRSSSGTQTLIVYAVSSNRLLFIEVDSNLVATGELDQQ